ncbi:MAG TPA: hypothetical protein VFN10_06460 [Thermoanaerobaculia bacterium]|nr:hypothetical protein [Thermoanaerobaculia bacterium]
MVERLANVWLLAISWALVLFFTFALFNPQGKKYGGRSTIDGTRWGVSPSQAESILRDFDSHGLLDEYLHQERDFDLLFPIVYSLALASALALLIRATGAPHALLALPFIGAAFDYVENLSVILATHRLQAKPPLPLGALRWTLSIGSRTKWILLISALAVIAALLVWWIVAVLARTRAVPRGVR